MGDRISEGRSKEDFALGLTIGMIYANFETFFLTTHRRQLDPQERVEVMIAIQLYPLNWIPYPHGLQ